MTDQVLDVAPGLGARNRRPLQERERTTRQAPAERQAFPDRLGAVVVLLATGDALHVRNHGRAS